MSEQQNATAAEILAWLGTPDREPLELPGGKIVYLHGWTDGEHKQWLRDLDRDEQGRVIDIYADAKMVVSQLRDAEGRRIFQDEDAPKLVTRAMGRIDRLAGRIMKLSQLSRDAEDDLRKNSPATPSSGSGSGS